MERFFDPYFRFEQFSQSKLPSTVQKPPKPCFTPHYLHCVQKQSIYIQFYLFELKTAQTGKNSDSCAAFRRSTSTTVGKQSCLYRARNLKLNLSLRCITFATTLNQTATILM